MSSDLFVRLFYTACGVFTGLLLWPIATISDIEGWNRPGFVSLALLFLAGLLVVTSVWWAPAARRDRFSRPRTLAKATVLAWACLVGLAAVVTVYGAILFPATALFGASLASFFVTLPAATLIVVLTWHVSAAPRAA